MVGVGVNTITMGEGIVCQKCGSDYVALVEYNHYHPAHCDDISEIRCNECGARFGRWSGRELGEGEWEWPPRGR